MTKQPQAAQAAASTARTGVRAPGVHPAPSRAATGHQAPTEAEIREAIDAHLETIDADVDGLIHAFVGPITYVRPSERGPAYPATLWDDLRPSEQAHLEDLVEAVYTECSPAIERMLVEATVRADLAFAEASPDAPRAEREQ